MSLRRIARTLGLSRGTAQRFVQASTFPERPLPKPLPTSLDPFKSYLHRRRWLEGCRNGQQLFREIQERDFCGSCSWVSRYVTGMRRDMAEQIASRPCKPPSSRTVTALFLRRPEDLNSSETAFISHLRETHPLMKTVCDLSGRFLSMVRQRAAGFR